MFVRRSVYCAPVARSGDLVANHIDSAVVEGKQDACGDDAYAYSGQEAPCGDYKENNDDQEIVEAGKSKPSVVDPLDYKTQSEIEKQGSEHEARHIAQIGCACQQGRGAQQPGDQHRQPGNRAGFPVDKGSAQRHAADQSAKRGSHEVAQSRRFQLRIDIDVAVGGNFHAGRIEEDDYCRHDHQSGKVPGLGSEGLPVDKVERKGTPHIGHEIFRQA